jgi:hypothetical protein
VEIGDVLEMYEPDKFLLPDDMKGHILPNRWITLKSGARLSRLWFLPGNGSYTEELVTGEHGDYWKCGLVVKLSGDSLSNRAVIERMVGRRFLVFVVDNNSKYRLMGSLDFPVLVSIAFSTVGMLGRSLSFSCSMNKQPYFVDTIVEKDLFGSDFSEEFSDDFFTDDNDNGLFFAPAL